MMIRALVISLLVLTSNALLAQNWFFNQAHNAPDDSLGKKGMLQFSYQYGKLLPSSTDGLRYLETNPVQAFTIRYGITTYGRKQWQQLHHYPTFGIGVSKFWFCPASNILGNPLGVHLFFNEPVLAFKTSSIAYDFSIGLSGNWKRYNQYTNPEQKAIGSALNFMIGFGLQYEHKLSKRMDLILGAHVDHFSNGRLRSPNRGINLYGVNTSLRCRISNGKLPAYRRYKLDDMHPMMEYYVVGSLGMATTFRDANKRGIHFAVGSIAADIARHYNYKAKYGLGVDLFYDASLKEQYNGRSGAHLFWPGVHLSHEYMVHRWTLVTQGGINLIQRADKGAWYGRISIRYDLSEKIFLRAGLRVYDTFISDFIEWGVGYSIYRRK